MCNGKNIAHNVHILYLMCKMLHIIVSLSLTDMRLINGRVDVYLYPLLIVMDETRWLLHQINQQGFTVLLNRHRVGYELI